MYYLHVQHPESLSDEEWAMCVKELEFIRCEEKKGNFYNLMPSRTSIENMSSTPATRQRSVKIV
jgi:hypothetical protein